MKNVLLLIHDDAGEEARFQAALDFARALSGHLTCLDIVETPVLIGTDYTMADAAFALMADARDREAENRNRIKARLAVEDIPWDWKDATADIARLLEAEAGLADVIVLNTVFAEHEPTNMRAIVSDVVIRAGKPIFAVPQETRRARYGRTCVSCLERCSGDCQNASRRDAPARVGGRRDDCRNWQDRRAASRRGGGISFAPWHSRAHRSRCPIGMDGRRCTCHCLPGQTSGLLRYRRLWSFTLARAADRRRDPADAGREPGALLLGH